MPAAPPPAAAAAAGTLQLAAAVTLAAEGGPQPSKEELQAKMAVQQKASFTLPSATPAPLPLPRVPPLPLPVASLARPLLPRRPSPVARIRVATAQEREAKLVALLRDRLAQYSILGKDGFEQVGPGPGALRRVFLSLGCC